MLAVYKVESQHGLSYQVKIHTFVVKSPKDRVNTWKLDVDF